MHPKVLLADHCSNNMPFCHALSPAGLEAGLSKPRLSSYQSLVGAGSPEHTVGTYVWSLELNSALAPLLSMVEVLLRNAIQAAATAAFGKPDWQQDVLKWQGGQEFQAKVAVNPTFRQAFYRPGCPPNDKKKFWVGTTQFKPRRYFSAAESKREEIVHRLTKEGKPNTPDQLVAHAMFGFWLDLFRPGFDSIDPLALWPKCTTTVFPNDATMDRARAAQYLDDIKKLRNRVSHHEPVWSLAVPKTPAGVQTYMTQQVKQVMELIGAMNQDAVTLLHNCGALSRIEWLLQPQTITAYAGQGQVTTVDMRRLTRTIRKLATGASRRKTAAVLNPTKAVHVTHRGTAVLTVLPHA